MYDVVLLVERPLSHADAKQVIDLHSEADLEEPVRYHVIIPVEEASHRVESALGHIAASEVLATSALAFPETDLEEIHKEIVDRAEAAMKTCLERIAELGREATGEITTKPPVDALIAAATDRGAAEAIVCTRPHVIADLLHIDWASKARRKLGMPVLHLLEHEQPAKAK